MLINIFYAKSVLKNSVTGMTGYNKENGESYMRRITRRLKISRHSCHLRH